MITNLKEAKEKLMNLGYRFDGAEEVLIDDTRKEKFNMMNLSHFDKIYKIVVGYVEAKLDYNYNMVKTVVPKLIRHETSPKPYIFLSKDFFENKCLCIIIPDRGDISPGVFNKSSLFYESLKKGSVFPYVDLALKENFSVLIMNPNYPKDTKNVNCNLDSFDHYAHCECIWNEFISGKKFETVIIIAHQLASISLIKLVYKFKNDFMKFVKKIALINSLHNNFVEIFDKETMLYFQSVTVNYIPSPEPEGSLLYSFNESDDFVENRSCGTTNLGLTHYLIYDDILKNYE